MQKLDLSKLHAQSTNGNDNMSLKESRRTGKFYLSNGAQSGIILPENEILEEAAKVREMKKAEELTKTLEEAHKNKQKEILEKLEGLEILPNNNRIIILPYPQNPYTQVITKGGILLDTGGRFNNPDTGEVDYQEELVPCGKVIEVGPETKYVKIGDDVYYDSRMTYPLPFMNRGYMITSEPQVIAILGNELKKRFKMQE